MTSPRKPTLLASTAIGLTVLAGGAMAQSQTPLSSQEVANLNDSCNMLLEEVRSRDSLPEGMSRDAVLEALRANEGQECVAFNDRLTGGETATAQASASASASD